MSQNLNQSGETEKDTMIFFPFNVTVVNELRRCRLNVEHVFILEQLYHGKFEILDIYDDGFSDARVVGLYNTLERKRYIVPDANMVSQYVISMDGKEFYEKLQMMSTGKANIKVIPARKVREVGFLEWWNLYPANSKWKDSSTGAEFNEARPLRTAKEQCKRKYDEIINSESVTHFQLIQCLKYEIKARKLDSIKKNINQMVYMKGSLSYLNKDSYLAYIDEIKKNPEFISDCQECDSDGINISTYDLYDDGGDLGN